MKELSVCQTRQEFRGRSSVRTDCLSHSAKTKRPSLGLASRCWPKAGAMIALLAPASWLWVPVDASAATKVVITALKEDVGIRPTSGASDLIGLLAGNPAAPIPATTFYIYGVKPTDRAVCIKLERLNGSYRAYILASINGADGSSVPVTLAYKSRDPGQLIGHPALEVSIRAKVSADPRTCEQSGQLVVAAWRPGPPEPVSALFLQPSGFATIRTSSGNKPCPNVTTLAPLSGQETGYDSACSIARPTDCLRPASIQIDRRDDYGGRDTGIDALYRPPC
jgi:hypothetical protein